MGKSVEDEATIDPRTVTSVSQGWSAPVTALTILHHADSSRVGERANLPSMDMPGGEGAVSRFSPVFRMAPGLPERPLERPYLSRKPLLLRSEPDGGVTVDATSTSTQVVVDGHHMTGRLRVGTHRLLHGVVLTLGRDVVLLLHRAPLRLSERFDINGLVGVSTAIATMRAQIPKLAAHSDPVLVRGPTGAGKELVARAMHFEGPRCEKPFVAVNMATLSAQLAASLLFGHVKGAFSGADRDHDGFFARANGGTLFLDEIGETTADVQGMLLRALETREILPLGARSARPVDVRLVAATDADLEAMSRAGTFRAPLVYRLSAHVLSVPPLNQRREDIGLLLVSFAQQELAHRSDTNRIDAGNDPDSPGWIRASLVEKLALYDWPGNVRQLRNVARLVAIETRPLSPRDHRLGPLMPPASEFAPPYASGVEVVPEHEQPPPTTAPGRPPREISDDELAAVLEENAYQLRETARQLGISRPALNDRIDAMPTMQRAQNLTAEEILAAGRACDFEFDRMWRYLRVSRRSLQLRISALGGLRESAKR